MAFKSTLTGDEYEALPKEQQDFYTQTQDGGWAFDIEDIDDHPQVKGLSNTLRKYKELAPDVKGLQALLSEAEGLKEAWEGMDPDETKEQLERLEELEKDKPDVAAQIEAAKAAEQRKFERQLEAKDKEIEKGEEELKKKDGFIKRLVVDQDLDRGLSHIGVLEALRPGAKAFLRERYRPRAVEQENDNGELDFEGIITTPAGDVQIKDFFERWKTEAEAEPYLPPSGNAGTGSRTSEGGGRQTKNPWADDSFNLTEQGRILKEKGRAVAEQMASAAGKTLKT